MNKKNKSLSKRYKKIIYFFLLICIVIPFNLIGSTVSSADDGDSIDFSVDFGNSDPSNMENQDTDSIKESLNVLLDNLRTIMLFVFLIALIVGVIVFIYFCVKLSTCGDNPGQRHSVIVQLTTCGICIAALGAVTIIYSLVFNIFS